jgi:hypothetical protein
VPRRSPKTQPQGHRAGSPPPSFSRAAGARQGVRRQKGAQPSTYSTTARAMTTVSFSTYATRSRLRSSRSVSLSSFSSLAASLAAATAIATRSAGSRSRRRHGDSVAKTSAPGHARTTSLTRRGCSWKRWQAPLRAEFGARSRDTDVGWRETKSIRTAAAPAGGGSIQDSRPGPRPRPTSAVKTGVWPQVSR